MTKVCIEGYTEDELLELPDEHLDELVFCDEALVIRAGSADVLGRFRISGGHLLPELAQVDGGGEGVLPTLARIARSLARRRNLGQVHWIVHAVHCAQPNLKLRRVLKRLGFTIQRHTDFGEVYFLAETVE